MERKRNINSDGSELDYKGADYGRITPFSIYCRTMFNKSPDKLSVEDLKDLVNDWKVLPDQFKDYYNDVANGKCGGNWNFEEGNEYSKKKQSLSQNKYGHQILNESSNQKSGFEVNMEQLLQKIDAALVMTSKSTPYDIGRWEYITKNKDSM